MGKIKFDQKTFTNRAMKVVKIAIGSCISILLADVIGVAFSASAGIITLLSIQDTKMDTIKIAYHRFLSFFLSLLVAFVCFSLLGYEVIGFGAYLLVFLSLSYLLKLMDGVSMSAVLTTHFLTFQKMTVETIGNECLLFTIGVVIGILVNLIMPKDVIYIKESMMQIEEDMKSIFLRMQRMLSRVGEKTPEKSMQKVFAKLEKRFASAETLARQNQKNHLFSDTSYYIKYLLMRRQQVVLLKRIYQGIGSLSLQTPQAKRLEEFFADLAMDFHEYNNVKRLLQTLDELLHSYEKEELPKTRVEFENRAILYTAIRDLQAFLTIKKEFVASLSSHEIARFWKEGK